MINDKKLRSLGINLEQAYEYTGNEENLELALKTFIKGYDKNAFNIETYSKSGLYSNYTTTVHSLKSNARTIGYNPLADLAQKCELLGKDVINDPGNPRKVSELLKLTSYLLKNYKEIIDKISTHFSKEEDSSQEEDTPKIIDNEAVKQLLNQFIAFCDDFDDDSAKEVLSKIQSYQCEIISESFISDAKEYIDDFDYENAIDVAKKAISYIDV